MKANVGGIDRVIRVAVGAGLIIWALAGGPLWSWIGIVPLLTGMFRFCPPYALLGFSTCKLEQKQ
jgi:hypothetical protein